MKEFKVLIFLDKFRDLFEKFGIDYDVMRKILQLKLTMDGRRVPTVIGNSNGKKKEEKEDKNSFLRSLWIYVLFSLAAIPFVISKSYLSMMNIGFGMFMFMIMTTLISDFSSVLLDVRDRNVIFSKPVNGKTLSTAKVLHIMIYMFFITIALTGIPAALVLKTHGIIFFIVFLIELLLMDLFIVVLTALLYLLILRFFDGEKLKDIINYVQIILSIGLSISYQFIGRMFQFVDVKIDFQPKIWHYFMPSVWFASPFELLSGNYKTYIIVFSLLSFIVPLITIVIYSKLLPSFEQNLEKLNNNFSKSAKAHSKLSKKLSKIFCRDRQEQIFFEFTSNMVKNERDFKLKVYPSLGFSIVFPFIFLFTNARHYKTFSEWLNSVANSKQYLNIYFMALLIPTIIMMMKYSGKYKGAWIYKAIPINNISSIFKGSIKAFIVKLIMPIFIFEVIIFIAIFGLRTIPQLVIVFLNMLLYTVICFKCMKKSLPFSESFESTNESSGLIVFPLMILIGALAGIHYLCTNYNNVIYVYMIILILGNWIIWKKAFNIAWDKL